MCCILSLSRQCEEPRRTNIWKVPNTCGSSCMGVQSIDQYSQHLYLGRTSQMSASKMVLPIILVRLIYGKVVEPMMEAYQKIQQPYKDEVKDIWDGHVIIEEKIDGSQFRIEINPDGIIKCGSHKQEGEVIASDFFLGVEKANHIFAEYKPEVKMTVFCEYLKTPAQNAIPYERVPLHNLIIFDVKRGDIYLDRPQKELFAKQHGMEITPLLWEGDGSEISKDGKINEAFAKELLTKKSILGHGKGFDRIEGIVIKNYSKFYDINRYPYLEGHWKCIKIVNDEFKEKNREENPNKASKFQELKDNYRSEARYRKAIQHCKEDGLLTGQLSDLKFLVPAVEKDIIEEEKENIKETLWRMFGKEITGYASKGMPEFYKKYLMDNPTETLPMMMG